MEKQDNWKPGDIAICINAGRLADNTIKGMLPPLRLNSQYVVQAVKTCECGCVSLDVGLYNELQCGTKCICGAVSSPGTHIHWANAIRFVKKKTREEIQEEIDEAVSEEKYELAETLRQQL
jgi:hypothetical protein